MQTSSYDFYLIFTFSHKNHSADKLLVWVQYEINKNGEGN